MFRFSIRDVLWLTVVVAMATCWYKDRQSMAATMAKAASDLAVDKKKVKRELALANFIRAKSQQERDKASQMLPGINDAHSKEVARLNKKIYQLEGPGYGDKVEPVEVAGKSAEWWADRAKYFERKLREAEQSKTKL